MRIFEIFKRNRRESAKERANRILNLCKEVDCGICVPPMDAQVALLEISRYLLGEDWCVVAPLGQEQINTEIVLEIEARYKEKRGV